MKVQKDFPEAKIALPELSDECVNIRDLPYKKIGDRILALDLFRMRRDEKLKPCVIIIHGGGWASGNKKMEWPLAVSIAKHGFITMSIEYRLSPEARYPAALQDIYSVVDWAYQNSEKYGIDTTRISLLGVSAGAHLATLSGFTIASRIRCNSKTINHRKIRGIINIDGVVDFTDPAESNKDYDPDKPSAGKRWLGYSFKENPKLWEEVSPLNYITKNSPPILFVNSSIERYHAGRDKLIEKYKEYKIFYRVHTIPDTPHTFWLFHPWFNEVTKQVSDFLNYIYN